MCAGQGGPGCCKGHGTEGGPSRDRGDPTQLMGEVDSQIGQPSGQRF